MQQNNHYKTRQIFPLSLPFPPVPKTMSYMDRIINHPKATASWSMIPQPRGRTPTATLPIRLDCAPKIPWASTTKYNIILPEMRRQTLKKPCSSTRHDHRSSTLTDAIQIPKKTLIPAATLLSLSLLMILTTQLQKGLSKAALREPKRPSSIQCHEERERERVSDRVTEASSPLWAREGGAGRWERPFAACGAWLLTQACVEDWGVSVRGSGARTKPIRGLYAAKWASPSG
jgi:hypothetical protein